MWHRTLWPCMNHPGDILIQPGRIAMSLVLNKLPCARQLRSARLLLLLSNRSCKPSDEIHIFSYRIRMSMSISSLMPSLTCRPIDILSGRYQTRTMLVTSTITAGLVIVVRGLYGSGNICCRCCSLSSPCPVSRGLRAWRYCFASNGILTAQRSSVSVRQ